MNSILFCCTGAMNPDIYSSQLSLGEIAHDTGFSSHLSANFDGISPIPTQEACGKRDSKLLQETKKLIRAVKQEDAYRIVCALKRGANPCLVINDVSALHIAAGIKSDQRCSMVSIRFCTTKNAQVRICVLTSCNRLVTNKPGSGCVVRLVYDKSVASC